MQLGGLGRRGERGGLASPVVVGGRLGFVVVGALAFAAGGPGLVSSISPISPVGQQASDPRVAVDAAGDRTVVWVERSQPLRLVVMSASRLAHARAWTPAVALSGANVLPDSVQLAVSPDGAAAIAWLEARPEARRGGLVAVVVAAYRGGAKAAWQRPRQLSPRGADVMDVALGIDRLGRPLLVWGPSVGPIEAVAGTSRGAWGAPQVLTVSGGSGSADEGPSLQLAVNDSGEALAVWQQLFEQSQRHPLSSAHPFVSFGVMAASRDRDGDWHAAERIGTVNVRTYRYSAPPPPPTHVVLNNRGGAAVLWNTQLGRSERLMSALRPADADWHAASVLTARTARRPVVASDSRGDQTAAWVDVRGRIFVSERAAANGWSPSRPLPAANGARAVWLSVNRGGDAIIGFAAGRYAGSSELLVSFRRGPFGVWRKPVEVGTGELPVGTLDTRRVATLVWVRVIAANYSSVIRAATHAFP